MPKCPKCNGEIDHLVTVERIYQKYGWAIENGQLTSELVDDWPDESDDPLSWQCPLCDAELFSTKKEVKAFLE